MSKGLLVVAFSFSTVFLLFCYTQVFPNFDEQKYYVYGKVKQDAFYGELGKLFRRARLLERKLNEEKKLIVKTHIQISEEA